MFNCPRDMELTAAIDVEAVAIPVCRFDLDALISAAPGALPVVARADCVSCAYSFCGAPSGSPPTNPDGWMLVGGSSSSEEAVRLVRRNLMRGAVVGVTRTPAVFKEHPTSYEGMPVWLVHVDPSAWIEQPLQSEAHLAAPFVLVEDPTADLPLFGPIRRHRLLPPRAAVGRPNPSDGARNPRFSRP